MMDAAEYFLQSANPANTHGWPSLKRAAIQFKKAHDAIVLELLHGKAGPEAAQDAYSHGEKAFEGYYIEIGSRVALLDHWRWRPNRQDFLQNVALAKETGRLAVPFICYASLKVSSLPGEAISLPELWPRDYSGLTDTRWADKLLDSWFEAQRDFNLRRPKRTIMPTAPTMLRIITTEVPRAPARVRRILRSIFEPPTLF